MFKRKAIYIGQFKSAKDAARAWDRMARELYGPDAIQNFT